MNHSLPKIIIDTDAGHDDALAMMLLHRSGRVHLEAVTTVAGNSTIQNVTRNARAILDLLHDATTPLYSGAGAPLQRKLVPAVVHGESGLDGLDMSQTVFSLSGDAVARMAEIITRNPGEVTILTLGPVTNVAQLFQKYPECISLIKQVVMMGGAIAVPGNKNRVAEFNFFVDPEAVQVVFAADISRILVPLDPCNDIILGLDTFERLHGTDLYTPLQSLMRHFIAGIEQDEGVSGALVYDALAAYFLIRPEAFTLEPLHIEIETTGTHTFGMTVAERRKNKPVAPNVQCVTKIDSAQFVTDLLTALAQ